VGPTPIPAGLKAHNIIAQAKGLGTWPQKFPSAVSAQHPQTSHPLPPLLQRLGAKSLSLQISLHRFNEWLVCFINS
jgi:hypothetical protein